jgi:hypothetical protein
MRCPNNDLQLPYLTHLLISLALDKELIDSSRATRNPLMPPIGAFRVVGLP